MQTQVTWARARPPGSDRLRRGAWYRVISDALGPMVVVDATNRVMTVPTHRLELRSDRPEAFSVVQRRTDDPNPVRGTPQDVGLQYAVCAPCGTRIRLSDESPELSCPACGHHARVTWDPRC